jgi:hypothetical protein
VTLILATLETKAGVGLNDFLLFHKRGAGHGWHHSSAAEFAALLKMKSPYRLKLLFDSDRRI